MKKFLKKVLAFGLAAAVALPGFSGFAADSVDYSGYLSTLKSLMDSCEENGISTDYEELNYKVIERFEGYINEDIQNGLSNVDFNKQKIEELYNETKANLEGYLAGTKQPKSVNKSDMTKLTVNGSALSDGSSPVFSIGYGHFNKVQEDIENLGDFGANNIQVEVNVGKLVKKENGKYVYNDSSGLKSKLTTLLNKAAKSNVGVCLLLSPHYIEYVSGLSDGVWQEDTGASFNKFDINNQEAKEILELYISNFLKGLGDYKALRSICLSNEPTFNTKEYPDTYNPLFREYLKNVHGYISTLNSVYGTTYNSFEDITMPVLWKSKADHDAIDYDWMEFNDKVFAEWHEWLKGLVKSVLPNMPVHMKMMGNFSSGEATNGTTSNGWYNYLERGTDLEVLSANMDIAGCDTWDYYTDDNSYYRSMFYYDYLHSALEKPVYNAEDHIIVDKEENYTDGMKNHVANNMWMGALHGRSMSTIWLWHRLESNNQSNTASFLNSILYRPDCVAAVGKTSLDLQRLKSEMNTLQQSQPKVALYYSKISRLHNSDAQIKLINAYAAILNSGQRVGVVSDKSLDKLSQYDVLVMPGVTHGSDAAYEAVKSFAQNGGKVLYSTDSILDGNFFTKDEYNRSRNSDELKKLATRFTLNSGKSSSLLKTSQSEINKTVGDFIKKSLSPEVTVLTASGGAADDLDWSFVTDDKKVLVNITNLTDGEKEVYVSFKGTKLENMTDLISGETGISKVTLKRDTPMLLSYEFNVAPDVEIKDVRVDKETKEITWSYSSEANMGANVYAANSDGSVSFIQKVSGGSYVCGQDGTYIIRAVRLGGESEGQIVSVFADNAAELAVTEVSQGSGYVSLKISLKNTKSDYISPVVALKSAKGEEKSLLAYKKMTVAPGKTTEFKLYATLSAQASGFEVSVFDSILSQNLLCGGFLKSFSNSAQSTLTISGDETEKAETAKLETTEKTENAEEAEEAEISDTKAENAKEVTE